VVDGKIVAVRAVSGSGKGIVGGAQDSILARKGNNASYPNVVKKPQCMYINVHALNF